MPENFKGLTSYRGFYRLLACPCIYRFTSRLLECQQKCIKRKNNMTQEQNLNTMLIKFWNDNTKKLYVKDCFAF